MGSYKTPDPTRVWFGNGKTTKIQIYHIGCWSKKEYKLNLTRPIVVFFLSESMAYQWWLLVGGEECWLGEIDMMPKLRRSSRTSWRKLFAIIYLDCRKKTLSGGLCEYGSHAMSHTCSIPLWIHDPSFPDSSVRSNSYVACLGTHSGQPWSMFPVGCYRPRMCTEIWQKHIEASFARIHVARGLGT